MDKNIAISVQNVSKTFKIPHEKISSLRGAFTSVFKKKSYEEFQALDNVSFEVKKGEFFGIIGRNGSGKSTLLKVLAGIYQANKGTVEINGLISPFLELGIGFNPELSGRDNVYLNATVLGMTKKQIDEKFDSIIKFSELERFIDQKLKNYSSGMQVRLAFSVAIHANREILLMDEVLAVGDSNFQSKCLTEFNRYKEMGKTVILVTHDTGTVQKYCDRVMLVRKGRIVKVGNAEEVGNAYIYENMSDEGKRTDDEKKQKILNAEKDLEKLKGKELENEKRRIEVEKIKLEEERKKKIAEITKVEFLDKNGIVKNVFETGNDIILRIYFELNDNSKDINFGIGIYSESNVHVFGTGTIIDKVKNKKIFFRNGHAQIKLKSIPLKKGLYFVKVGIFGENSNIMHAFLDKSDYFRIFETKNTLGIVEIKHEWQC